MGRTMCVTQEGPANALALNKDNSHVVIAGRNVFKVFSIEEDEFVESLNLRVGKNLNLNFSCNDVAWNINDDDILATAATNGAVVVWNLSRPSRSKQEYVFGDHKRTVNKVSFHVTESNWLISGSQDGTMKCFDLRTKEAVKTFYSNTESVRDVQFSPHAHHQFAAVSENGNVQLWDMRSSPDRCYNQFTAHSGPVFACDWHPDTTWLATASRDKTIKVWDLSSKPSLEYTIPTIASVGHIKWRPQRKFHIASCALVVDCSVNVWDVRRPYIPFAAFNEHRDVPTGVAWRGEPLTFLSTSRDCTLYQHGFQDATRPADKANPQGLAINSFGDISHACRVFQETQGKSAKLPGMFRKSSALTEQFCNAQSSMHRFESKQQKENKRFKECAKRYLLTGRPLADLCDHNSAVARDLGMHQIALVWIIIKTMFPSRLSELGAGGGSASSGGGSGNGGANTIAVGSTSGGNMSSRGGDDSAGGGVGGGGTSTSLCTDPVPPLLGPGTGLDSDQRSGGGTGGGVVGGGGTPAMSTAAADEDTEPDEGPEPALNGLLELPLTMAAPHADFFFGDHEVDPLTIDLDRFGGLGVTLGPTEAVTAADAAAAAAAQVDWTLPTEAFQLRHEIRDRTPPPEHFHHGTSPDQLHDHDVGLGTFGLNDEPQQLHLCVNAPPKLPSWNPMPVVSSIIRHHANLGDVQTSVTILMALGETRRRGVDLDVAEQEHLLLGYLDMLSRRRLYDVATLVIQLSWIPSVAQLNQQSTCVNTSCGRCGRPLQRSGWLCDRCHTAECSLCSVCHQPVKGLYVWCQGCAHGGHLAHLQDWFSRVSQCPAGCGHTCEYN